jgi:hypothetical protein
MTNTTTGAVKRGMGMKLDTPHRRRMYKSALGPKGLFTTTPTLTTGTTSLAEYEALCLDQGQSGSCFPAGTPILMADFTERPIEEIGEGNEVRTHTGKRSRVTKLFRRTYDGYLYSVKLGGWCYPTMMTDEHPVCVVTNASKTKLYEPGEEIWVKAADLQPGDFVLMPANMAAAESATAPNTLVVSRFLDAFWERDGRVRTLFGRTSETLPSTIKVDAVFARLMGLFLAEGSYRKGSDGSPNGLSYTFARHERNYQNFVITAMKDVFGVEAVLYESDLRSSVSDIRVYNSTLACLFFTLCGEGALTKNVPPVFYESARDVRIALLRGWLEGDGTQDIVRMGKKSAQIHGHTSSEVMHRGLFRLAMLSGLKPGTSIRKQEEHQNAQARCLSFYSNDILELFPEAAEEIAAAGLLSGTRGTWYRRYKHGFLCRVKAIEKSEPDEPVEVFNLEVEGEHTYIANAIAVHNCEGHSSAMAAWISFLASGNPLPFFPSPDAIYKNARCQERAPNADGSLSPLTDGGAMTSDVVTIFQTCGLKKMGPMASDGRYSDVDMATVNDEPRLDELDTEAETPVLVENPGYAIDLSDTQQAIAVIQAALKANFVVRIDIICDSIFQNYFQSWTPGTPPLSSCNPNDPSAGGHAVELEELTVTSALRITAAGLNSWGACGAPALIDNKLNPYGHWQGDANWFKTAVQQATVWACKVVA